MNKKINIKIEVINPPTKKDIEQKLKELSKFLSNELSKAKKTW